MFVCTGYGLWDYVFYVIGRFVFLRHTGGRSDWVRSLVLGTSWDFAFAAYRIVRTLLIWQRLAATVCAAVEWRYLAAAMQYKYGIPVFILLVLVVEALLFV